jgi:hypothetical protein
VQTYSGKMFKYIWIHFDNFFNEHLSHDEPILNNNRWTSY